jgi:hypothetical protein
MVKDITVQVPPIIKELTGEELRLLSEFKNLPVYTVLKRIVEAEIEIAKSADFNIEPDIQTPERVEYYQKGKRKGRVFGLILSPVLPKYADLEIAERLKKK